MIEYLDFIFSDPGVYARTGLAVAMFSVGVHSLLRAFSLLSKPERYEYVKNRKVGK